MAASRLRPYLGTIVGGAAFGLAVGFGGSHLAAQRQQAAPPAATLPHDLVRLGDTTAARYQPADRPADRPAEPAAEPAADAATDSGRLARWRKRWAQADASDLGKSLGWHLRGPHPLLTAHYEALMQTRNDEEQRLVLFPLCGASVDLAYIARRGHQVVGVDGVPQALDALLADYGEEIPSGGALAPDAMRLRVAQPGWVQQQAAKMMSTDKRTYTPAPFLFGVQGDFLEFGAEAAAKYGLGSFDAAFDRGGLVAIAPADRPAYATNLGALVRPGGKLLLVAVEHEPAFGPPHHLGESEVRGLLGRDFDVRVVSREDKLPSEPHWRQRGATSFTEVGYLCTRK